MKMGEFNEMEKIKKVLKAKLPYKLWKRIYYIDKWSDYIEIRIARGGRS